MAIRIVRLGSPRAPGEGLRLGTVRRPPRGVPKSEHASRDFYDLWLPDLAPSESLLKRALKATDERSWLAFVKRYRAEMKRPEAARLLSLLAALSHQFPDQSLPQIHERLHSHPAQCLALLSS